jgi:hypothetical protein
MSRERWKPVPGYEGLYAVSDRGGIMSVKAGRAIGGKPQQGGIRVSLWRDGEVRGCFVHRLVMAAFVGPSDMPVRHKDGDKSNNRLENLEYVSMAVICRRRVAAKQPGIADLDPVEDAGKLEELVRAVRRDYMREGATLKTVAERHRVSESVVQKIIKRQWWAEADMPRLEWATKNAA